MSGELVLNREAMRVVQRNDKDIVTYRKRYRQGDVVDTSKIDSTHVENLRASRVLVPQDEYDAGRARRNPGLARPAPQTIAVPSHSGEPVSDEQHEASYDVDPNEVDSADGTTPDGTQDNEPNVDKYDGMAFADLQQEAKSRDLNAGGSAEELRTRLREADADES